MCCVGIDVVALFLFPAWIEANQDDCQVCQLARDIPKPWRRQIKTSLWAAQEPRSGAGVSSMSRGDGSVGVNIFCGCTSVTVKVCVVVFLCVSGFQSKQQRSGEFRGDFVVVRKKLCPSAWIWLRALSVAGNRVFVFNGTQVQGFRRCYSSVGGQHLLWLRHAEAVDKLEGTFKLDIVSGRLWHVAVHPLYCLLGSTVAGG